MTVTNPFDSCSELYDRFRPDYPIELVEAIHRLCAGLLVDVGAGTGKGSAPFAERGVKVVSIEPSSAMVRQGLHSYPNLIYVQSAAEELPIASSSASVVISAQAFHWFDGPRALREFARVLKPGGHVCLFWNVRDPDLPAPKLFDELIQKWNPGHDPGYGLKDVESRLHDTGLFSSIEHFRFTQTVTMTIDDWIGLSRSISYVQSIGAAKLPGFEAELSAGLAALSSLDCRYIPELWVALSHGR